MGGEAKDGDGKVKGPQGRRIHHQRVIADANCIGHWRKGGHPIGINVVTFEDHHGRIAPNGAPDQEAAPKPSGCVFAEILHAKIPIGRGEIETEVLAIDHRVAAGDQVRGLDDDFPFAPQPRPAHVQLIRGDVDSAGDIGDRTIRHRRRPSHRVIGKSAVR